MTGRSESALARASRIAIVYGPVIEACRNGLAPTTSTTLTLAIGDALAVAVSDLSGMAPDDFRKYHPGGKLGKRFLSVGDLMHAGDGVPRVGPDTTMKDVIYEMSRKGLGVTTVQDADGRLMGVVTDGDLRRLMEREPDPLGRTAEEVMHPDGVRIPPDELATSALKLLEERRITSLVVCSEDGVVEGVLHLHDLWGVGLF